MCSYILEIYSHVDMTPYIENKRHSLCVLISCKTNIQPGGHAPIHRIKQTNMVYMFLYLGKTNIQAGGHAPIPRKQTNTVYVFLYLKKKQISCRAEHATIPGKQKNMVYMFLYLAKQIHSPGGMPPYIENKRPRSMRSYILQNK